MRVKCINNNNEEYLTKGKIYDVRNELKRYYKIMTSAGVSHYYPKELFEMILDEEKND